MKKVILLGDSIRQGYDEYVVEGLKDVARVYYPEENCRFAAYFIRILLRYLLLQLGYRKNSMQQILNA